MPKFHQRTPQGNANKPAPTKADRDSTRAAKADRTESKRLDRADDKKARDWVKQQRRKDR